MNEEIINKSNAVLDRLLQAMESGMDKAPLIFENLKESYFLYFIIKTLPLSCLGVALIAVIFYKISLPHALADAKKYGDDSLVVLLKIGFSSVLLACIGVAFYRLQILLAFWVAPEASLIEMLRSN